MMLSTIQLVSLVFVAVYFCTCPVCCYYMRKLRKLFSTNAGDTWVFRRQSAVFQRQYSLTMRYLIVLSLASYLFHPLSMILFYFADEISLNSDRYLLPRLSYLLNDISLFCVIYFALSRYGPVFTGDSVDTSIFKTQT